MWDSSWSEDFFSFFNILFARLCIYFATICEGSKKFPHLWINIFRLHDVEEKEDTVKTDLIYAVRVKMRNWYSTCRAVVMKRDQRICRCTCQVTQYFQDWRIVYFPLFINETNSTTSLPSPRREETKIKLFYSFILCRKLLNTYATYSE